VTEEEIIEFVRGLPGAVADTASQASGAPQIAWGDTFFFYAPDPDVAEDRQFPFATIVIKDYTGFDEASRLDRPGVFRLNVSAGRQRFVELLGYQPHDQAGHDSDFDYGALDTVLPHPTYARQGWVSIVNPGERTADLARTLLTEAHDRVVARHKPRP
jgi:hypothetical protein